MSRTHVIISGARVDLAFDARAVLDVRPLASADVTLLDPSALGWVPAGGATERVLLLRTSSGEAALIARGAVGVCELSPAAVLSLPEALRRGSSRALIGVVLAMERPVWVLSVDAVVTYLRSEGGTSR